MFLKTKKTHNFWFLFNVDFRGDVFLYVQGQVDFVALDYIVLNVRVTPVRFSTSE